MSPTSSARSKSSTALLIPGGRVIIVTPHYTDFSSFCDPTHRSHLTSFSLRYFGDDNAGYGYYTAARFHESKVHVRLLALWRYLGFEFLVNQSRWFRRFWEFYLCYVIRGKVIEWHLEVLKKSNWAIRPDQLLWKLSDHARQTRQARSLTPEAALGKQGEDLAHRYLQKAGYAVIARNYKVGSDSEIDIVARKNDLVVFVEVKSRRSAEFGLPDRAMNQEKHRHITRGAKAYATRAGIDWSCVRFDVISVIFSRPPSILHQQDAFYL